jgi:hypothetical protein
MPKPCCGCEKPVDDYLNYCTWECHVEAVVREGGRVHTPNGLPIRCIKADGTLLEHEHGDHPTYMYPVDVEYVGELTDSHRDDARQMTGKLDLTDDQVRRISDETHALIYADDCIALTLHECCYATWSLRRGTILSGPSWLGDKWKLTDDSLKKIKGG